MGLIKSCVKIYAKWSLVEVATINSVFGNDAIDTEITQGDYGLSLKLNFKDGTAAYFPLENSCNWSLGQRIPLNKVMLLGFKHPQYGDTVKSAEYDSYKDHPLFNKQDEPVVSNPEPTTKKSGLLDRF